MSEWVTPRDTAIPGITSFKDGDLQHSSVLAGRPVSRTETKITSQSSLYMVFKKRNKKHHVTDNKPGIKPQLPSMVHDFLLDHVDHKLKFLQ